MKTIFRTDHSEKLLNEAYEKTLNEWAVKYKSLYIDTRFGKTHVITAGPQDGEPLILLHGFAFSSTMWKDNIKDLSKTTRFLHWTLLEISIRVKPLGKLKVKWIVQIGFVMF